MVLWIGHYLIYKNFIKKLILILLFIPLVSCVDGEEINGGACDIPPNPEIICTKEYEPVCACNNLVYGNTCEAEKAGNLSWKSTQKDSGEECKY